jgi:hypothetical protein
MAMGGTEPLRSVSLDIERFAAVLEAQRREWHQRKFPSFHCPRVKIVPGPKYTKIDETHSSGQAGKFMVDNATGEIFGIKAYGKVHKGHAYGTLDTIDQWDWGGFRPVRLAGEPSPQRPE